MYLSRIASSCLLLLLVDSSLGDVYHKASRSTTRGGFRNEAESDPEFWYREAQDAISSRAQRGAAGALPAGGARHVVMFLGDGMSVPTLAAARTLLGQRQGAPGEEAQLSFEAFPTLGLAKTYCLDAQVADSACSATAYLCGAKANYGTLGVSGAVPRGHCTAARDAARRVDSIAAWALSAGRDVGVVTTTRVTHASPAGAYAHSAERDWESDADVTAACGAGAGAGAGAGDAAPVQEDIALQLVGAYPGNRFKVILGGGRREFLPASRGGRRRDSRDLLGEWARDKAARNASHALVGDRAGLLAAARSPPDYLLGLFAPSHLPYRDEADPALEPSLAELTEAAIGTLAAGGKGFFLFVEGGRIDHAHHENQARRALAETLELSAAVARALALLPARDSLVLVTADHAHAMSYSGYSARGADVLGAAGQLGADALPYMTLSYANGPGYRAPAPAGGRDDVTLNDYQDPEFRFPAGVPLDIETHGGDDVAVFAWGVAHGMFSGLYEQSQLPHLMAYAACLGPGAAAPHCAAAEAASAP